MADTHEKKVEKKVVKHEAPAPKADSPAPQAPERAPEHAQKAPEPPSAPAHRPAEQKAAAPVKKVEKKLAAKAEEKPAAKKEEPGAEAPAEAASPASTEKAPPAGGDGEVEAEIVEEPGEKEKAEKPGKKKGKKKERKPHIKPVLSAEVVKALALRKALKDKTPHFIRQEAYNYGRLGMSWRKPRGTHSKLRHHISYRINVVSIGYGGPKASKGLHPSGFREVLVHHPLELDDVDPKTQAARIARGVGYRKRLMIQQRAQRKGIRVLNEMQE